MALLNLRCLIPPSTYNEKSSQYDIQFCCIAQHPEKPPTALTISYEDFIFPDDKTEFECKAGKLAADGHKKIEVLHTSDWFKTKYPGHTLTKIGEIEIRRTRIPIYQRQF